VAATVTLNGTNVTLAQESGTPPTGWGQVRIRGTGGSPTISASTDVFLQGTQAVTSRSTNSRLWLYFDYGSGLNFSTTHAGKHISIWANFLAAGLMQLSTYVSGSDRGGLCLCLGSSTSNYSYWNFGGKDTYAGGWIRLTVDPSKTASGSYGTGLDLTSVRYFGVIFDTDTTAKFDNAIIDRIDFGYGLTVTGTSTSNDLFGDILYADEGTVNNKYGYVRSDNGVIYAHGLITLGDGAGTLASTLTDVDRVVIFEQKKYMNSSSAWVDAVSSTFHGLKRVGNNTNGTSLQFGVKVGSGDTAKGRNGLTIASAGQTVTIDLDDGHTGTGRACKVYGTTFRNITGTFALSTNTAFEFVGNTVDQCGKVTDINGIVVRNCIFSGTKATDGAIAWGTGMDIKNSNFIANTTGAAVLHSSATGSPFSYDNLQFSGNTYDVNNTSGSSITVAKDNGSNPSTYTGSTVTFSGSVSVSVTVVDKNNSPIQNAQVGVYVGATQVINADTNASGVASGSWTGSTPQDAIWKVRRSSAGTGTKYIATSGPAVIAAVTGMSVKVVLQVDPNA
jgi:hypothetical protein